MRPGVIGIAIVLIGSTVVGPGAADHRANALDRYFHTLDTLSQRQFESRSWDYFGSNELSFHENYAAVEGRTDAILGVGFQQNFSLALRSDGARCIILDIEPTVGVLIPFFGILFERYPTRRGFLSKLMGVELTEVEFRQLVEPERIDRHDEMNLEEHLKSRIAGITRRVSPEVRRRNIETLRELMLDEVLARTRIPRSQFPRILSNLDSLLDAERSLKVYPASVLPGDKQRGLLEFLYNHASVAFFSRTEEERLARASWFSTEENYSKTRDMWFDGRITGIIADLNGPRVGALGRWLEERGLSVDAIYVSNLPEYFSRQDRRGLFDNLRSLPLEPDAVVLMTRRSGFDLYPRIRSFDAVAPQVGPFAMTLLVAFGLLLVVLAIRGRNRGLARPTMPIPDLGDPTVCRTEERVSDGDPQRG